MYYTNLAVRQQKMAKGFEFRLELLVHGYFQFIPGKRTIFSSNSHVAVVGLCLVTVIYILKRKYSNSLEER